MQAESHEKFLFPPSYITWGCLRSSYAEGTLHIRRQPYASCTAGALYSAKTKRQAMGCSQ